MARPPKNAPLPDRRQLIDYVKQSAETPTRRDIARAFGIRGADRAWLKETLRELEDEGLIIRHKGRRIGAVDRLPPAAVLEVTAIDDEGEVLCKPVAEDEAVAAAEVTIRLVQARGRAPGVGDRVLARLRQVEEGIYEARPIRFLGSVPHAFLAIYENGREGGVARSVDRRVKLHCRVAERNRGGAEHGEYVRAEPLPGRPHEARIIERIGSSADARSFSLIAIRSQEIPVEFPRDALAEAEGLQPPALGKRTDFRQIPLVTIDGPDARDFDDAVWAGADDDPANPGGWILVVAIADVAWYVRPQGALDESAYERGNSVYFPDRAVPMLPEALSNGWCSLKPGEDRPCLAARIWLDADGVMLRHRITRAMMRSAARLTYEQVQRAHDGEPDDAVAPLLESSIRPLYGAYRALAKARAERGVLEIDVPERRVVLDEEGRIVRVEIRARYDSHRLIEDFMIAANVAAAETLERMRQPSMYRVHDEPTREKLDALREFLDTIGLKLVRGHVVRPAHFNIILEKARATPHSHLVNEVVLRSQAQAAYAPENIGHFGLGLVRYCHFTSPIRRYSDLLVHRALIRGLKLGAGGLEEVHRDFRRMGEHLSSTERRAAEAERDAVDRLTAAHLSERVGATFAGKVRGVTRAGLFVTLDDTGADGLLPMSLLGPERHVLDERRHRLKGQRTGREYRLGDRLRVRLREADPVSGGIIFALDDGREGGRDRDSRPFRDNRRSDRSNQGPPGRFRRGG